MRGAPLLAVMFNADKERASLIAANRRTILPLLVGARTAVPARVVELVGVPPRGFGVLARPLARPCTERCFVMRANFRGADAASQLPLYSGVAGGECTSPPPFISRRNRSKWPREELPQAAVGPTSVGDSNVF